MELSLLFCVSNLSKIMSILIVTIGAIVAQFARNYLHGDSQQNLFYYNLLTLQVSVLLLVHTDNLFLFSGLWLLSNLILVRMICHKSAWKAAQYGADIVKRYLLVGWLCLVSGVVLMYLKTGALTFTQLTTISMQHDLLIYISLLLCIVTAMIQSAVMPVHTWLLNTLNAPTPVSACMHAGLINAGIFLLARLAPLYLQSQTFLYLLFVVGVITATIGVACKLIQPNVKRMLVCSTIAQMGFVFVQCGLGFFTAAIAHIFWHGLFKAYLFLSSATIEEQKDPNLVHVHSFMIIIALLCGFLSAVGFILVQGFDDVLTTTTVGLVLVAFVAGVQLGLTILQTGIFADIFVACLSAIGLGVLYAMVDVMIHSPLHSLHAMQAQPLTIWYGLGLFLLLLPWCVMIGYSYLQSYVWFQNIYAYVYVYLLRVTQAKSGACTLHRNHYKYR